MLREGVEKKIKAYNQLTKDDKENIVKFYYEHRNIKIKDIGKILNMSQRAIPRVLNEFGINTRLKNRYVLKNENYFSKINTEFKAYIIGFIYADGFVGTHNDFCISLTDKVDDNLVILNRLQDELGCDINLIYHNIDKDGNGKYTFKFSNEKIIKDLNKCGVFTCKSLTIKEMPNNVPNNLINHFIRGYFDGDGTICSWYDSYDNRKRYCLEILGTNDFLNKMQNILCSECNIKRTKLHNVNRVKGLTRISYKGIKNLIKIRDYLYNNATIFLTYKHDKFYNISPCK